MKFNPESKYQLCLMAPVTDIALFAFVVALFSLGR